LDSSFYYAYSKKSKTILAQSDTDLIVSFDFGKSWLKSDFKRHNSEPRGLIYNSETDSFLVFMYCNTDLKWDLFELKLCKNCQDQETNDPSNQFNETEFHQYKWCSSIEKCIMITSIISAAGLLILMSFAFLVFLCFQKSFFKKKFGIIKHETKIHDSSIIKYFKSTKKGTFFHLDDFKKIREYTNCCYQESELPSQIEIKKEDVDPLILI